MGIVIRQSFKALVSNYVGVVLGFISLFFVFPYIFTPHELGLYRLLIELAAILAPFALVGTNYSINKYFAYFKNENNGHNGFFYYVLLVPSLGLILVLSLSLIFKEQILSLFSKNEHAISPQLWPILICMVVFSTWIIVSESVSANFGRIAKPYFIREVVQRILLITLGVLYALKVLPFYPMLWGMAAIYALNLGLNIYFLSKLSTFSFKRNRQFNKQNKPLFKDMARFSGFLFFGSLTSLVVNKLDFVMVAGLKNLTHTAIYSIGFYLAIFIELPKRGFLQILTPIVSNHLKDQNYTQLKSIYNRSSINLMVAGSMLFAAIWVNLDLFYHLMPKGHIYVQGKYVVLIMGVAKVLELSTGVVSSIIGTSKYYGYAFINFFSNALVAVLGNYLLIPILGINGAAFATLGVIIIGSLVGLFIVKLKFKMQPYNRTHIWVLLLLAALLAAHQFIQFSSTVWLNTLFSNLLLLIPFSLALYFFRFAPDINEQIRQFYSRFIKHK